MPEVYTTILQTIQEIREQKSLPEVEMRDEDRIMDDLGLKSLDIAQLLAILEVELDLDPFSEGVPLDSVYTIGELRKVYEESQAKKA